MIETRDKAHQRPVPLRRDRLQLLLRPFKGCTDLREATEQERPCSVLPHAVPLRLGLEVQPLVGVGPHA
eukprot:5825150-Alexandrium_andersonii.AAC.1